MKVQVNNREMETTASTITGLAAQSQLSENGIAIAMNNQVIPHPQWGGFNLHGSGNLIVIKVACGG